MISWAMPDMAFIRRRTLKAKPRRDGSPGRDRTAYQVRWSPNPSGGEVSRQFETFDKARDFKTRIEAELQGGTYIDPRLGKITFKQYVDTWQRSRHVRPATNSGDTARLKLIIPMIGNEPIGVIRRSHIQGVVDQLVSKGLSPAYIEQVYILTKTILRSAFKDELIPRVPTLDIVLPEIVKKRVTIPTVDQVRVIAARVPARYRAAVWLAAGAGLRVNEIVGLPHGLSSPADSGGVDFLRRELHVRVQGRQGAPPKSAAGVRDIPLAPFLIDILAAHLAEFPPRESGRVINSSLGTPVARNTLGTMLRPILRDLGFTEGEGWHLLRHFYASMLIRSGLDPKTVQIRMGHASHGVTMDIYGHLWPDSADRSRDAVQAFLGGPPETGLRPVRPVQTAQSPSRPGTGVSNAT